LERFGKLLELSKLHTQVLITGIIKQKTTSWWYNQLPTQEKRLMASFQSQWKLFNEQVIEDAREVTISQRPSRILLTKISVAYLAPQNAYIVGSIVAR
jgi:hypothetical protein